MLQRLQVEWMKLKNYRTFWILSLLYLVSIFGANYIGYSIQEEAYNAQQAKGMAEMLLGTPPYAFPRVWQMTSWVSSWLLVMPGLIMIISVTNEFNFKTHRQNIIDGWTRRQFITVKLANVVILAIASTLTMVLTALYFGFINGEPFSLESSKYIFYFFVQSLNYIMVGLLFALLFKRGGLAIGLYFLYALVLENILSSVLSYYFDHIGRFLPLDSTDKLIPFPVLEEAQKQTIRPYNADNLVYVAIAYVAAFFILSYRKFETDDL